MENSVTNGGFVTKANHSANVINSIDRIEKTFFDSKNNFEDRVALLLSLMNLTILPMVEFRSSKMLPTSWPSPATTIYMVLSAHPATSTKKVSCNGYAIAREI